MTAGDNPDVIFIDTSIQIARRVHRPEIKAAIESRLSKYAAVHSSLIVRQEFKRRLLKEALYLLRQLQERGSFQKVMRHVHDSLRPGRKQRIGMQALMSVDETDGDSDRTERAKLMFRALITVGLRTAEGRLARVVEDTHCACARTKIRELKKFEKYDFGPDKCSQTRGQCGIASFLTENTPHLQRILSHLESIPAGSAPGQKSDELARAEQFIRDFLKNPSDVENKNPCLVVGDLLIALESKDAATFYTMNGKESQHLSRVIEQTLIVRRPNSTYPDVECPASSTTWHPF